MKKRPRIDANQPSIVAALRKMGYSVVSLAPIGGGVADLLVARGSRVWLLEVKDGSKPPSQRQLTADQQTFHSGWPVTVVTSVDEAIQAVRG